MSASMICEAAKATSLLLSMGTSLHADPDKDTKPAEWRAWFKVICCEMDKAMNEQSDAYYARLANTPEDPADLYKLVDNTPHATPGPPHDELAPEPDPIPTEDHEQTFSLMAAFGDGSAF